MGACTLNACVCVYTCVSRKIRTRLDLLSIPQFCCLHIQICVRVHRDWCFEAFVDVNILGAGDDLLSSAAGKPRYVQCKRLRSKSLRLAHLQEKAPRGATCPGRRGRVFFVTSLYVRDLQSARFGYRQTDIGKPKRTHEKGGEWPYKQAVSGLLWISGMTRPSIASAVRAVARHAHSSAERHWKAVRKIIAYLKATKDLGVVFQRGGDLKLSLFADADYADRCNDRRSVLGVSAMLRNTAVSASSTT